MLLGYRPAWKWNHFCIVFLQLWSLDNMPNLLCVCVLYVCVPCLSHFTYCMCGTVHVLEFMVWCGLCEAGLESLTNFNPIIRFQRWGLICVETLRSQSAVTLLGVWQLTPQAVFKDPIVCSVFNYTAINAQQSCMTWETMERFNTELHSWARLQVNIHPYNVHICLNLLWVALTDTHTTSIRPNK